MSNYHLDYETFSEVNAKKVGPFKYAEHPSTEILMFAIGRGQEPAQIWDCVNGGERAVGLLEEAIRGGANIYAHNATFEHAISINLLKKTVGIDPPEIRQWRCTAAMCRMASIPPSLEGAGDYLRIDSEKDKTGKRLIKKFSMPRKPTKKDPSTRIHPQDDLLDFAEFKKYCIRDVEAEREIHDTLKRFELTGETLNAFQLDLAMNTRGLPVNVPALQKCSRLLDDYEQELSQQFFEMVGVKHTRREAVLKWAKKQGYNQSELTAGSVHNFLQTADKKTEVAKALRIRQKISFAAVKKIAKMLECVSDDGHVKGGFLFAGASRTHRTSGKAVQPQNMKRSTSATVSAFPLLSTTWSREEIELYVGPLQQTIAASIRHFIGDGNPLLQADYSSVEACGAPWLSGDEQTCNQFRQGVKKYELMASEIFGCRLEYVSEVQRFVGKQAVLGCGFNMSWTTFRSNCEGYGFKPTLEMVEEYKLKFPELLNEAQALCMESTPWEPWHENAPPLPFMRCYNQKNKIKPRQFDIRTRKEKGSIELLWGDPSDYTETQWLNLTYDHLAWSAVKKWRESHPIIVQTWKACDNAAKNAIRNPGEFFEANDKIKFKRTKAGGFDALVMFLPGGHKLVYPEAHLKWSGPPNEEENLNDNFKTSIRYWGEPSDKSVWGWVYTYGGKLFQNATQAICCRLMWFGAVNAWKKGGYLPYMLVHDESISPKLQGQSLEHLMGLLCEVPAWAKGFPLKASGEEIPFYMKT